MKFNMAKEGSTRKSRGKKLLLLLNVLVIAGLAVFGGYYFKKYQDANHKLTSPEQAAQEQVDAYIAEVGKLYALPKDEKPSVATVKDKEQLKDQPFFANAQNGDVTLIYSNAKLAILYRPSTKQLVNVSSVTIQNKPNVRVIGPADLRAPIEKTINDKLKDQFTLGTGSDSKAPHSGVLVVDLNGQQSDAAKKLAETLKGQVGELPAGEDKPAGVDILIFVGQ
jgi:hypothetical protein